MLTAEQLRAARALLRIEQADLAKRSGVSVATIKRFEAMDGPIKARTETVELLRDALDALGVIFIPKNGDDVGVRLRKPAAVYVEPASASKPAAGAKTSVPKKARPRRS
jgi:transcriptional regulator with XRE-family HTH domain